MRAQELNHMFNYSFEKSVEEVKEKCAAKAASLKKKIAERESRIAALRKEYGIDDAALVELLTQARRAQQKQEFGNSTYTFTSISCAGRVEGPAIKEERTVGAGVVNNLLTENDFIEAEKEAVKKMNQIVNNLRPKTHYTNRGEAYSVSNLSLGYDELEYLGF